MFSLGPIRRVDQMEGSTVIRGKRRSEKTIGERVKRDLCGNGLNINMIYDIVLWRRLIHITDSIYWKEA